MKSGWLAYVTLVVLCSTIGWHPVRAATLFGLVDTGELFASDDGGVTWTLRFELAARPFQRLVFIIRC